MLNFEEPEPILADGEQEARMVEPKHIPNPALPEFKRKSLLDVKGVIDIFFKITPSMSISSHTISIFSRTGNRIPY